jgi:hypothetical protein
MCQYLVRASWICSSTESRAELSPSTSIASIAPDSTHTAASEDVGESERDATDLMQQSNRCIFELWLQLQSAVPPILTHYTRELILKAPIL